MSVAGEGAENLQLGDEPGQQGGLARPHDVREETQPGQGQPQPGEDDLQPGHQAATHRGQLQLLQPGGEQALHTAQLRHQLSAGQRLVRQRCVVSSSSIQVLILSICRHGVP